MNIGDLLLRIVADLKDFEPDLVKKGEVAGEKAGTTLGQRMGTAIKTNIGKVIAAGGAIFGAIAIRGIQELTQFTSDFRSETGATADEADRAKKAILGMSERNIQPIGDIGKALIKVHTDMGLVGDEATTTTEKFLKFARVTKRDAADEVVAFDGILDAWRLTAKDSGTVMDALVVSHQRYGGVIAEDERVLQALAPALIAANMSWQDGLEIINLFKASGVDAADSVGAMNKAFAKVKSPTELKALIADLIATTDNTERANKAIDLFGPKAGPKLANILQPGIGSLDSFNSSGSDTAGAMDEAAAAIDNTFGARFQMLIKAAGTKIIEFGDAWGGLATVIATALTVAGGLGGNKLAGALAGMWKSAAASGPVTKAVAFAASKAATVYLTALYAGDAIGGALAKAWAATGGRMIAAATASGAMSGTAFAAAATAAIIAAPAAVIIVAIQIGKDVAAAKAGLAAQIDQVIQAGTLEGLQRAKAALVAQIGSQKILGIIPFQFAGEVDAMNADIARIDAAIATLPAPIGAATTAAVDLDKRGSAAVASTSQHFSTFRKDLGSNAAAIVTAITSMTSGLLNQATALINGYYDPIIAQDDLRVQKDTVNALAIARNATTAGTAERRQADLTLANAQKNLDQTRANLLASGTLTAKDQKAWLAELQARYKTATGDAKTKIGELIAKLQQLRTVVAPGFNIFVALHVAGLRGPYGGRAAGGPVTAGQAYWVNENTPNSEMWVPSVSGTVYPSSSATPVKGDSSTNGYNVQVAGLMRARNADEIGASLRRLGDFGVLPPRAPE